MENERFYTATDVKEIFNVSLSYAWEPDAEGEVESGVWIYETICYWGDEYVGEI